MQSNEKTAIIKLANKTVCKRYSQLKHASVGVFI